MLKVPKFDFSLLCIAFLLAVRDIAVGLQLPVFVFLLFIFIIIGKSSISVTYCVLKGLSRIKRLLYLKIKERKSIA